MKAGFTKASPEVMLVDQWPPMTLTKPKMRAYRKAEEDGLIYIQKVQVSQKTGAAMVQYLSTIPAEWIRPVLADYAKGVVGT